MVGESAKGWLFLGIVAGMVPCASGGAQAGTVRVRIENLAPSNGTFLTPLWVGFHDGTFDVFDVGAAATPGLEALAEDGETSVIASEFNAAPGAIAEGTILGPVNPPIAPGQVATRDFDLGSLAGPVYFSYASMVIPSNDAFISNGNPLAFQIIDSNGNFVGADFTVPGQAVWDAGTEVNDEVPSNTAFFGQTSPNTGINEGGTVQLHAGFLPPSSNGILADPRFAGADFTSAGYQVARITVENVPEPATALLLGVGLLSVVVYRRRLQQVRSM